jgi:hypothetical protein
MILNTHLKNINLKLTKKHKGFLGMNIARSFKTRYPNEVLKKVKIKEENESLEVYDYPKEFLLSDNTTKLIKKFISNKPKKNNATKKIVTTS